MCEFKKGDKVIVWDYFKRDSLERTFYAFDETLERPFLVTYGKRIVSYKYCEKAKPKIVPMTRVIVWRVKNHFRYKRYATGDFDENGFIKCWVDGGDEWSSDGRTSYWKHWKLAEDE
jgi:hypothetical protein